MDYTQLKQDLSTDFKRDGNYFYLKNQLGGSEKILVGKDLSKVDLSKINLRGKNLIGANLSGQDLQHIDLSGTLLRGANLSYTNLSGQNLSGKDLRGINFHGANLENSDLTNITISKVIQFYEPDPSNPKCSDPTDSFMTDILMERCVNIIGKNESIRTDFSNANMRGVKISPAPPANYIHFVNFEGADLAGVDISDLAFQVCIFKGANFYNNNMINTAFVLCDFSNAELINTKFVNTIFQEVSFHQAKIIDGSFKNIYFFDYVNLSDADLNGTSIADLTMLGNIDLRCKNHQICD